jgi:hypothetical protein
MSLKTRAYVVSTAVVLALAVAPAAHATTGTCSATPNPVIIGVDYTVNGAGLVANDDYVLHLQQAGNHSAEVNVIALTDGAGAFTQTLDWVSAYGQWHVGDVDVSVYDYDAGQNTGYQHGPKQASCSFGVVA